MSYAPGQDYQFRYTLAIAMLLHGLIIFGITIGTISVRSSQDQMEVTLSLLNSEIKPEEADFLAQTNQQGSGSAEQAEVITVTRQPLFATDFVQDVQHTVLPASDGSNSDATNYRIVTTSYSDSQFAVPVYDASIQDNHSNDKQHNKRKTLAQLSLEIASLEARLADRTQSLNRKTRVLRLTSASTLAADNAEYVHRWRDRIETIGNMHYPQEARNRQLYGDVRLLVRLQKSGVVEEITIMSSSGSDILDRAAIESIRLASPFEPFPQTLAEKYDRIEVIRTWQFRRDRVTSTSA